MVRFYWHVDDGCSAHIPVKGVSRTSEGIVEMKVEMDVPGVAGSAMGIFNMPKPCPDTSRFSKMHEIGILLAHDVDSSAWQGPLLASIAQSLAKQGFLVMRNYCNLKELRRLRMFEKALDTAAKSPYAAWASIKAWILVGLGNGARVAATVANKAKVPIAGLAVLSYPLYEATPPAGKGAGAPDSTSQLLKCTAPLLVLHGEHDKQCKATAMRDFCLQMHPERPGPWFGIVPGVDESLTGSSNSSVNSFSIICQALLSFAQGVLRTYNSPDGACASAYGVPSVQEGNSHLESPTPDAVAGLSITAPVVTEAIPAMPMAQVSHQPGWYSTPIPSQSHPPGSYEGAEAPLLSVADRHVLSEPSYNTSGGTGPSLLVTMLPVGSHPETTPQGFLQPTSAAYQATGQPQLVPLFQGSELPPDAHNTR